MAGLGRMAGGAAAAALLSATGGGIAGAQPVCVVCTEPAQTYVCRVDTTSVAPDSKAMQLYCIVRTAKEGNHRACAVSRSAARCDGIEKIYSYDGPAIPAALESAAARALAPAGEAAPEPAAPARDVAGNGPPETVAEMTARAARASRERLRTTGETVTTVTRRTGERVGSAAQGVGEAAQITGRVVGRTARTAFDCVRTLFRNCGSSER